MKNCTPLWREAHICKSKVSQSTLRVGPLLEVELSKKCTPVWREAHLQVKICKAPQAPEPLLEVKMVEKVHAVGGARHLWKSKCTKHTTFLDHFWKLRCLKKCTPLWCEARFRVNSVKAPLWVSDHLVLFFKC